MPAPRTSAAGGRAAVAAAASSTSAGHSSAASAARNRTTSAGQNSTDIIPVIASSSGAHAGETSLTATVPRPVAITAKGLRQFVTTASGVRVFLQNCVATVNLQTPLDLTKIATHARNAEYNPKRFKACILRLREPRATGLLFASGKVVVTGARNEDDARISARKLTRLVQRLSAPARFVDFGIQNIVANGGYGFPIRLEGIAAASSRYCSYEPEIFPGLIYRMEDPKMVIMLFVSGNFSVIGAKSRSDIISGLNKLHPLILQHKKQTAAPTQVAILDAPARTPAAARGGR